MRDEKISRGKTDASVEHDTGGIILKGKYASNITLRFPRVPHRVSLFLEVSHTRRSFLISLARTDSALNISGILRDRGLRTVRVES